MWERENLPGIVFNKPWKWLLLPGLAIQWVHYMFPSGSFSSAAGSARQARSELLTYMYSAAFYAIMVVAAAVALTNGSN